MVRQNVVRRSTRLNRHGASLWQPQRNGPIIKRRRPLLEAVEFQEGCDGVAEGTCERAFALHFLHSSDLSDPPAFRNSALRPQG